MTLTFKTWTLKTRNRSNLLPKWGALYLIPTIRIEGWEPIYHRGYFNINLVWLRMCWEIWIAKKQ